MQTGHKDRNSICRMIVEIHKKDTRIYFRDLYIGKYFRDKGNKKEIYEFSERSCRNLRHYLRNSAHIWQAFIGLTYPREFPCDGKAVKRHADNFCHWLRNKKIKYFWVFEFQRRGAPHLHFLTSEKIDKDIISRKWYEIVGSNDENHLRAGTRCDAVRNENHLMGYMFGYLKKLGYQKTAPEGFENVGRWWGCSRDILQYTRRVFSGTYNHMSAEFRTFRKWYKSHLRKFGIKWKWRGHGYTSLDGTHPFLTLFAAGRIFKEVKEIECIDKNTNSEKLILLEDNAAKNQNKGEGYAK